MRLDCQLYGTHQPGLHHLTNVVLHAAVAISLFLVLWQMTGNLWPSAFVAAVFAVHPLRAESVAWVAERKDLLSGLFFMLTLGAYLRYVRRPFSWARYLLVIAMFALGLMAKPMLVTLPFVLLLLDYWPLGRFTNCLDKPLAAWHATPVSRLLIEKIPLLMMAAVSCRVTSLAQHTAIIPVDMVPIHARIVNALVSYVAYIGQFFYPSGLVLFYPYPTQGVPLWKVVGAAAVLVGISVAAAAGAAADALSVRRLVLVRGNARAGDRAGAGRVAVDGGPLHLLAADRAVHRRDLGRGRGGAEVPVRRKIHVLSSLGLWRRFRIAAGGADGMWVAADVVLERQRDDLDPHAGFHDSATFSPTTIWARRWPSATRWTRPSPISSKATALSPTFAMSYANLGAALDADGQSDAAATAYLKAELSPSLDAIDRCRKALELNPDSWFDRVNLGNALAELRATRRGGGRVSESIEDPPRLSPSPTTTSPTS